MVQTSVDVLKSIIHNESLNTTEKDDENKEEQGYLWLCKACEDRPTFETVKELFTHKKTHNPIQVNKQKLSGKSKRKSSLKSTKETIGKLIAETVENCTEECQNTEFTENVSYNKTEEKANYNSLPSVNFQQTVQNLNIDPTAQNEVYSQPIQNINYSPAVENVNYSQTVQNVIYNPTVETVNYNSTVQNVIYNTAVDNINYSPNVQNVIYTPTVENVIYTPTVENITYPPTIEILNYNQKVDNIQPMLVITLVPVVSQVNGNVVNELNVIKQPEVAISDSQEDVSLNPEKNVDSVPPENAVSSSNENVISDSQENAISNSQENVILNPSENVISSSMENSIEDSPEDLIANSPSSSVSSDDIPLSVFSSKNSIDIQKSKKLKLEDEATTMNTKKKISKAKKKNTKFREKKTKKTIATAKLEKIKPNEIKNLEEPINKGKIKCTSSTETGKVEQGKDLKNSIEEKENEILNDSNSMTTFENRFDSEDDDGDNDSMKQEDDINTETSKSKKKSKVKNLCKICNTEFSSRCDLSQHKKTHLFEDTGCYKCETCGRMCPKYDNFTRHLTIHFPNRVKNYQCNKCFSSFYNLADLKKHEMLHLTVKPFTCEHCGEGFTREDSLLIHAYKHTGIQYKKFTCKDCDKVLNSPSALVMHAKTHSVKTVFCTEPGCKFSCYLQSQLRQHIKKHSGEKPYQCAKCGRCFVRNNDMKNHILNVHEGIKPYKCPSCPKTFAVLGNLKIHEVIHSNMRPYLCAQCGKFFNQSSTLRKHTVSMHNPLRSEKEKKHKKIYRLKDDDNKNKETLENAKTDKAV